MGEMGLMLEKEFSCSCGKVHRAQIDDVIVESGAVYRLPEVAARYGAKKVFVLADANTYRVLGEKVCGILQGAGLGCSLYVYQNTTPSLEPDEAAVGSYIMHFDCDCDMIVSVGSGVLNDIGKIAGHITGKPYVIVGTAPSMDGYASAISSMVMDGLKVSLPSGCANVIIGDLDILKNAPVRMLQAGLGDMLAKYVSLCEWRISHIINGEYYCETIADMVRNALKKCVSHADALLNREEEAVKAVFEGLVISGFAMSYAGVSRPASGSEHYFSHIWDMRSLAFGTHMDLHGIQCAVGTLSVIRLYEQIKLVTPDREKALAYAAAFDRDAWFGRLRKFLGKAAEAMILLDDKEHKYDVGLHAARLEVIMDKWGEICRVIEEELPSSKDIAKLLKTIGAPAEPEELGVDRETLKMTFMAAKDIRDKYVLPRLAWDLGVIEEMQI